MAGSEHETYECDALVVGSGCAGLSATVTAGHRGLNVLIVEKEPRFGGTTARPLSRFVRTGGWELSGERPASLNLGIRSTSRRVGSRRPF